MLPKDVTNSSMICWSVFSSYNLLQRSDHLFRTLLLSVSISLVSLLTADCLGCHLRLMFLTILRTSLALCST